MFGGSMGCCAAALLVMGMGIGAVVFICSGTMNNIPKTTTNNSTTSSPKAPPPGKDVAKLTMAKYQQIKEGMSYQEVVGILGFEGEELSRNTFGDLTTIMFVWKGDGFANMNATFQNDKLVSKAQFGLR
jgi:hypothetical protein